MLRFRLCVRRLAVPSTPSTGAPAGRHIDTTRARSYTPNVVSTAPEGLKTKQNKKQKTKNKKQNKKKEEVVNRAPNTQTNKSTLKKNKTKAR